MKKKKKWGKTELRKVEEKRAKLKLGSYSGNEKAWDKIFKEEEKHHRLHGKRR